jgi:hypothetical protein
VFRDHVTSSTWTVDGDVDQHVSWTRQASNQTTSSELVVDRIHLLVGTNTSSAYEFGIGEARDGSDLRKHKLNVGHL